MKEGKLYFGAMFNSMMEYSLPTRRSGTTVLSALLLNVRLDLALIMQNAIFLLLSGSSSRVFLTLTCVSRLISLDRMPPSSLSSLSVKRAVWRWRDAKYSSASGFLFGKMQTGH